MAASKSSGRSTGPASSFNRTALPYSHSGPRPAIWSILQHAVKFRQRGGRIADVVVFRVNSKRR